MTTKIIKKTKNAFVKKSISVTFPPNVSKFASLLEMAYLVLVRDDIEMGYGNVIPFWILGFIY
jgi:hypothetical protein